MQNRYLRLRFGLVNTICTYLGFKFRAVLGGIFYLLCVVIEFTIHKLSPIYFYIPETLQTSA